MNIIFEPETNYTLIRLNYDNADIYLKNAKENHSIFKFNSAIKNSENSIIQSNEGIKLANIEEPKNRDFKNWVKIFGVIGVILLIVLIVRKFPHQN